MDPGLYLVLKETNNGSNTYRESTKRHKSEKRKQKTLSLLSSTSPTFDISTHRKTYKEHIIHQKRKKNPHSP